MQIKTICGLFYAINLLRESLLLLQWSKIYFIQFNVLLQTLNYAENFAFLIIKKINRFLHESAKKNPIYF